jgi:hypothetical protein
MPTMSASARTVFVFGVYLAVLGLGLLAAPGLVLAPFGLPEPQEVWVRVSGVVVAILGLHYLLAGRHGLRPLFGWTVATRTSVILVFAVLVSAGLAPAVLLLFGAVDLAGAVWTWAALRQEAMAGRHPRPDPRRTAGG